MPSLTEILVAGERPAMPAIPVIQEAEKGGSQAETQPGLRKSSKLAHQKLKYVKVLVTKV